MNYAILKTGGKQYRVKPGDVIDVEKLSAEEGSWVELTDVLAVSRDGEVVIGHPVVPDASVLAQVRAQDRDKKIIVFKYKRKTRYRRKKGHRQPYTRLAITSIVVDGEEIGVPELPPYQASISQGPIVEQVSDQTPDEPVEETTEESRVEVEHAVIDELSGGPVDELEAELGDEPSEQRTDGVVDEPMEGPTGESLDLVEGESADKPRDETLDEGQGASEDESRDGGER